MRSFITLSVVLLLQAGGAAQPDVQSILDTDAAFAREAVERGSKTAFLEFLTDDAIIFRPSPINGISFLRNQSSHSTESLVRNSTFADISANGLLGYTTGNWRSYQDGKSEALAKFGQYATIWGKDNNGKFKAVLDITTTHEKLPFSVTDRAWNVEKSRDLNERAFSPADASMHFFKTSMTKARLVGGYKEFAAKDVRILIDQEPPILGKGEVVSQLKKYKLIDFPKRVAIFQSADMAYIWNHCGFADNNEDVVLGNCLHIWKLRDKKWWIVLGVFARIPNTTQPVLKERPKKKQPVKQKPRGT